MKPTLFLLAAGMGSRYGGLKQLDGLGPNGETIMDYSIYDAINAGFGKLVFVIRKDFEQDFRDKIISKYEGHIPCELVFQSIDDLPEGFTCQSQGRSPVHRTAGDQVEGRHDALAPYRFLVPQAERGRNRVVPHHRSEDR